MADLNIPNLNKKSNKYLFKKKLNFKRKSKRKLLIESFYMLILSFLIGYVNYLIPNKIILFQNFIKSLKEIFLLFGDLFTYVYQILLVICIFISLIFVLILLLGSLYRIFKVLRGKNKNILY
tara:strand:- start:308 stop:673 length:366 start_codon:yes stop_codon:yes gene_type:complete